MSLQITCIIPAYNVAPFIGKALHSALSQKPRFSKIIVVDDGSTDTTAEVIQSFNDARVSYVRQENKGLGPARNTGIELADTEYLYFLDADDVLASDMLSRIHATIRFADGPVDAVLFSAEDFRDDGRSTRRSSRYYVRRRTGTYATGSEAMHAALISRSLPVCAWLSVFRRDVLDQAPALRFRAMLHEDEIFTPELLSRCARTVVTNEVLYRRRLRSGSIMNTPASIRNVQAYVDIARYWLDLAARGSDVQAYIYQREAYKYYSYALVSAARGGANFTNLQRATQMACPEFLTHIHADYRLARLSKKAARTAVKWRAILATL